MRRFPSRCRWIVPGVWTGPRKSVAIANERAKREAIQSAISCNNGPAILGIPSPEMAVREWAHMGYAYLYAFEVYSACMC